MLERYHREGNNLLRCVVPSSNAGCFFWKIVKPSTQPTKMTSIQHWGRRDQNSSSLGYTFYKTTLVPIQLNWQNSNGTLYHILRTVLIYHHMTITCLVHWINLWEGGGSSDQVHRWEASSWNGVDNRVKNSTKTEIQMLRERQMKMYWRTKNYLHKISLWKINNS